MSDRDRIEQWARLDRLFDQALALAPAERPAFVERETTREPLLRTELLALLAEVETRGDLLDRPALDTALMAPPDAEVAGGSRIGAYRVLSLLGRGGMGEVYLAERADGQFEHQVALKLLRQDSGVHVGRFIAERRILAGLDHPGIARLLDAGVTADGRPYMVMERVDGVGIVAWCRQRGSVLAERLQRFLEVCDAVEYAHRNLVVHRDLKPGNVMVGADGRARLLDFGVAKRLGDAGGDATRDTPLSLAYAAPEQLTRGAVTTATDTYALGVMLYELVAGRPPWQLGALPIAVAIDKLLHEEPAPASVAAAGEAQPPVPPRVLRGDLDAILARALRKDAAARYPTAASLAEDLRRHLRGEPVQARGGARLYVVGRFVRRYRWQVAALSALLLALVGGLAGTLWQARAAARERDIARTEAARSDAVRDYVMLMFREAGADRGESELTAKAVLERAAERLIATEGERAAAGDEVFQLLGELFAAIDDYEGAAPIYRRYLEAAGPDADPKLVADIRHDLAVAEFRLGESARARELLAQAQGYWNTDPERHRESLASSRVIESQMQRAEGDLAGAIATLERGLESRIAISGHDHRETAYLMNALALAHMDAGDLAAADRLLGESLAIMQALGKADSANALTMLSNQAVVAARLGDVARAEPLFERAVALRKQLYGRSAALAALQHNLGRLRVRSGRAAEALPLLDDALAMAREFGGERSPLTLTVMLSVAEVRIATGDGAGAETALQAALAAIAAQFDAGHVLYARGEQLLARLRLDQGRRAEAARSIDAAERKLQALGPAGAAYLPEIATLRARLDGGTPAGARP